jgi:betaine reductase
MKSLRIVHYLNQFFGGVGGEDKAQIEPRVIEGFTGPGTAVQNVLGEQGKVVATAICGDNTFAEKIDETAEEILELIRPFQPDAVIAGPAFGAGRYGIACGAVCKAVQERLGIPTATGMNEENPGIDLFRPYTYIVKTPKTGIGMADAVSKMVSIVTRLAAGQRVGKPSEEGYFSRGLMTNELSAQTGAERAVAMLLNKLKGKPFESEISLPQYDRVEPAPRIQDMGSATVALITDGGLVPAGNPDKIESVGATRFGAYPIEGVDELQPDDFEVYHIGYDPVFIQADPNRLVPVDVLREMENEGVIGKLHNKFYSTSGAVCIVENIRRIGQSIAEELKAEGVSCAILTST